jgi:hypothetical protein
MVREIGRLSLIPCQSQCSAIPLTRFTRTIPLRHPLVPFFNLENPVPHTETKIVGGYGDAHKAFNRLDDRLLPSSIR